MKPNKRIKFLITLAITIVISLFVCVIFQIVNLNKTRRKIEQQREQIERLEKEIDYLQNKLPTE